MLIQVMLLLGLVIASALLIKRLLAKRGMHPLKVAFMTFSTVLLGAVLVLAASGRLHWIAAAGAALIPFLRLLPGLLKFVPLLGKRWQSAHQNPQSATGYSEVDSEYLRMTLTHASGAVEGEILKGSRRGSFLGELDLPGLIALHREISDTDSLRLLESYLNQYFPDWSNFGQESRATPSASTDISPAQALEILGLGAEAKREDIIAAHRKLIQRVHPDRGGSSFLAAQLNEAKRVLLKRPN